MRFKPYRFVVILAASAVMLASFTPTGQKLEGMLLHLGSWLIPERAQESAVAVVAIDDSTIKAQGAWPWPRDRLAEVIDRLSGVNPATIGVMLPLNVAETDRGVAAMKQDVGALDPGLQETAGKWLDRLDTDTRFAQSLEAAGNVVLATPYRLVGGTDQLNQELNTFALKTRHGTLSWFQFVAQSLRSAKTLSNYELAPALPQFLNKASGTGLSPAYDNKQWVHGRSLAVDVDGRYLPGFELSLWAAERDVDINDISVLPGEALKSSNEEVVGTVDLSWYPHPAVSPPVYSLDEIMRSDVMAGKLRNKTVLLGLTATGQAPELTGPKGVHYTPVTWAAQVLASMHAGNSISMPVWFYSAQRLLVVLFAVYLVLIPVSWHGVRGLLATLAISAIVVNAGLGTLIVSNLWLPGILPVMFLVTVQLMLMLSWHRRKGLASIRQALLDTRVLLATHLQSQGQLDRAMEQYLMCLPEQSVLQPLYDLGLEYERHRQVGKAQIIYEKLAGCRKGFRDVSQRSTRLATLSDRFPGAASNNPAHTLVLDAPVMELPVLGRYRVERELGHGSMGTVYLAVDPTIGREVAVKTLPLLQEYEGAEQAAIAERFFKEAEAVGRLDHPNIVTVYDAGKEHDLAYIAMDYVPGASLDSYTGKPDLLPVWEVLEVAAQVADALDYAHKRNIVHRDIKPANILYDRDSGVAKITDFGVARLLDTSRTRTGTILGSPSYMSPEQVSGKKIDGRSDLFSLGVTLYQLLSGSLPFKGDSVATLMYQIANQKTPPVRKLRSDLPISISRLINKALQKNAASRFDSGVAMANAIRKCRTQFRGGRRKTA